MTKLHVVTPTTKMTNVDMQVLPQNNTMCHKTQRNGQEMWLLFLAQPVLKR